MQDGVPTIDENTKGGKDERQNEKDAKTVQMKAIEVKQQYIKKKISLNNEKLKELLNDMKRKNMQSKTFVVNQN